MLVSMKRVPTRNRAKMAVLANLFFGRETSLSICRPIVRIVVISSSKQDVSLRWMADQIHAKCRRWLGTMKRNRLRRHYFLQTRSAHRSSRSGELFYGRRTHQQKRRNRWQWWSKVFLPSTMRSHCSILSLLFAMMHEWCRPRLASLRQFLGFLMESHPDRRRSSWKTDPSG